MDVINLVVNTAKVPRISWKKGRKKYCLDYMTILDFKNALNCNWHAIMLVVVEMNVLAYLQKLETSYFTYRLLKYDAKMGLKNYSVIGCVLPISVLLKLAPRDDKLIFPNISSSLQTQIARPVRRLPCNSEKSLVQHIRPLTIADNFIEGSLESSEHIRDRILPKAKNEDSYLKEMVISPQFHI